MSTMSIIQNTNYQNTNYIQITILQNKEITNTST